MSSCLSIELCHEWICSLDKCVLSICWVALRPECWGHAGKAQRTREVVDPDACWEADEIWRLGLQKSQAWSGSE